MNILISGGTGFLGRAFAQAFLSLGHSVTVLSRNPQTAHVPAGVQVAGWDGATPTGWGHLIETTDALVNLAGENIGASRWSLERKARIHDSRVRAGQAITAAVQQASHRPAVLVQSSAVGYYGVGDDRALDEDSPAGTDWLSSICLDWEASTQPVEALGVRRAIIRTGLVLSAQEGVLPRMLLPFRLFVGGPVGSGRQWLSWIALADMIGAVQFLFENDDCQGEFNLTAPQPVTNAQFGKTLARVMRRPYWMPAPAFALQLAFGEMSTLVLDGQRVLPKNLLERGYSFRFSELQPALEAIL